MDPRTLRKSERGGILLTLSLLLPVMLGMMALCLDIANLYRVRVDIQTAADAASFAGAHAINRNESGLTNVVLAEATRNGFDDTSGTLRTVNNPPLAGEFAGNSNFVEVIIERPIRTYFIRTISSRFNTVPVRARSVSGVLPSNGCLYTLDPNKSKSFNVQSDSEVVAPDCSININSNQDDACSVTSNSSVTALDVNVVGECDVDWPSTVSPDPNEGIDSVDDPLEGIAPPDTSGPCTPGTQPFKVSSGTATLSPGVYCQGIDIGGGATVTFLSGTYILRGGGLLISSSTVTGNGVTFYNTFASGYDYKPIKIGSGSTVQLSAPTAGGLRGIVLFQDRDAPAGLENEISSDGLSYFDGTLYFPTQVVKIQSNSGVGAQADFTAIVAASIDITSDSVVHMGGTAGNSAILEPVLVE